MPFETLFKIIGVSFAVDVLDYIYSLLTWPSDIIRNLIK